jgi:hypothetical protein
MLLFPATFGGLLLMMGHDSRSESLFYYFRLEDQVPENHLLRLIDRHVNFEFMRAPLKDCYSDTGGPSIDPERLLRMLLIGLSLRGHERKETGGRATHASGVAWVHGTRLRSGDSAPLDVFQEPAWTISGIESVSGVL